MAFDNFNWQHNNRGASDPALKPPAAPANTNEINRRRKEENERRRREAIPFSGPSTKDPIPTPPRQKPAPSSSVGWFSDPVGTLMSSPVISAPMSAASAVLSTPVMQSISSFVYDDKDKDGIPEVLGIPLYGTPLNLSQKEMTEWALSGVPVGSVARFGTYAVKATPAVIKTAGSLDSKFIGGALAATVAGIGYEAHKRGLFGCPEISGNPEVPKDLTSPSGPGLPAELTPDTSPRRELTPKGFMSGRTLKIQPDIIGISQNPLRLKTDSAIIGGDSGVGFGPMPDAFKKQQFPKFGDDLLKNPAPSNPVMPDFGNKPRSPVKTFDEIVPESPKAFDFVQPQTPVAVSPQTSPATSSGTFGSISSPSPQFPNITTPAASITPATSPGIMSVPFSTPFSSGSNTIPVHSPTTPSMAPLISTTPRHSNRVSTPVITVPDTVTENLVQDISDGFDFGFPTQSRPGRKDRTRRRYDLPEFSFGKPKMLTSTKMAKEWYVKNPVPSVIFGKTPKIKTPKIKIPRMKL